MSFEAMFVKRERLIAGKGIGVAFRRAACLVLVLAAIASNDGALGQSARDAKSGATAPKSSTPRAKEEKRETKNKLDSTASPASYVLPEPALPVQQLQNLGPTPCVDVVTKMSHEILDRTYDVQSGWNREAPTQHVFQSVAVLNTRQNEPQNGLAALIATPTPGGSCDGVALQVFPLAGDCPTVQRLLQSTGSTSTPILSTQIMFDRSGKRLFLLPGVAKTCIAVAVDSTFGDARK